MVSTRAMFALTILAAESASAQAPSHTAPRDTVDSATYEGWKQYSLQCARCHGDDGVGSSFGPNLLESLRPDGALATREAFAALLAAGRPDKGMPAAKTLGLGPEFFDGIYAYLSGRSAGRLHGGRPARRGG